MNVQDWWKTASDRERTTLVAEKVMGWTTEGSHHPDPDMWEGWRDPAGNPGYADIPWYSADPKLVWDILSQFKYFEISRGDDPKNSEEYMVALGKKTQFEGTAFDAYLCNAVCLAALIAVED